MCTEFNPIWTFPPQVPGMDMGTGSPRPSREEVSKGGRWKRRLQEGARMREGVVGSHRTPSKQQQQEVASFNEESKQRKETIG